MYSSIIDLVNLFNEWSVLPGFAEGAGFVVFMMFLGSLIDAPFIIRNLIWQRRAVHNCNLRCEGKLDAPCHMKGCPAHETCPHYKPRERWRFLSVLRQRK